MKRIYLDHAATTPLCDEAKEAMQPWLQGEFGNPSSLYHEGRRARAAIDEAREKVSTHLGCDFGEVVFTSSGTEAANLAIVGAALAAQASNRKRVLAAASEHHAVLETGALLAAFGFQLETVRVDRFARIDLTDLEDKLSEDVLLVATMHANNELGTLQPVRKVAELAKSHGVLFFCDAVQTFGHLTWTVQDVGADFVGVSAHKLYGPKGVGALAVRAGTPFKPLLLGGGQEREMRAGTENVAGIVGFGAAVDAAKPATREARDSFLKGLPDSSPTVPREAEVLPGHAHVRYPGLSAESMLIVLDRHGVSASSGAACSSGSLEPSHVLLAAGYSEAEAKEGLRFTFGRGTSVEDAREAAARVEEAARQVRGSPHHAAAN